MKSPSPPTLLPKNDLDKKIDARRSEIIKRTAIFLLTSIFIFCFFIAIFLGLASSTEKGTYLLWNASKMAMRGRLHGKLVKGTLLSGGLIKDLFFQSHKGSIHGIKIKIDNLEWRWKMNYKPWSWKIAFLKATTVDVSMNSTGLTSSSDRSKKLFRPPLPISLVSLDISHLRIYRKPIFSDFSVLPSSESDLPKKEAFNSKYLSYEFREIRLSGKFYEKNYHLSVDHIRALHGTWKGRLSLSTVAPFKITSNFDYLIPSPNRQRNWIDRDREKFGFKLNIDFSGSLKNLLVKLKAIGTGGNAEGEAELAFFDDFPFKRAFLKGGNINPYFLIKNAPKANLSIDISLKPKSFTKTDSGSHFPSVIGDVTIHNASPGNFDNHRLPINFASLSFVFEEKYLWNFKSVYFQSQDGSFVSGKGIWNTKQGGKINLKLQNLNLHSFHKVLRATKFNGEVILEGDERTHRYNINLLDKKIGVGVKTTLRKRLNFLKNNDGICPENWKLDEFIVKTNKGFLSGRGSLSCKNFQKNFFSIDLKNFNPFLLILDSSLHSSIRVKNSASVPESLLVNKLSSKKPIVDLSGKLQIRHFLKSNSEFPVTQFELDLKKSFYDDAPLKAKGKIQFSKNFILASNLSIEIAHNHFELAGKLINKSDNLKFKLNAPNLDKLGFGLAGQIMIDGNFFGNFSSLICDGNYSAHQVAFAPYRIGSAIGKIKFSMAKDDPLEWKTRIHDLYFPNFLLRRASIDLRGTQVKHNLLASWDGEIDQRKVDMNFLIDGSFDETKEDGNQWSGVFSNLANRDDSFLRVNKPISFIFKQTGFEIGPSDIEIEGTHINWAYLIANRHQIASKGYIHNFEGNRWFKFYQKITGQASLVTGDLVLDSNWDFAIKDSSSQGSISLNRRGGYIARNGKNTDSIIPFSVEKLNAMIKFSEANAFHFTAEGHASQLGNVSIDLRSAFKKNGLIFYLDEKSYISGKIKAFLPNLSKISHLLGPEYSLNDHFLGSEYDLKGCLLLNTQIDGSVASPIFKGELLGSDLSLSLLDSGLSLREGEVDILLDEKFINLKKVTFKGGEGRFDAYGKINLKESGPDVAARIIADRLKIFNSPERQLVISGKGKIKKQAGRSGIDIRGKIFVNRALFDLPKFASPKLSEDVLVIDDKLSKRNIKKTKEFDSDFVSKFAPFSRIVVDFGNNFRFQGRGAKLDLIGQLIVHSEAAQPIKGYGEIRIGEGSSYEFMGRKFAVENGVISVDGPIDNPSLHLRAMRRNQEVEVGIKIAGTLKMPKIDFISEPPYLALEEKLSWLLFGRGSQLVSSFGQDAASNAALGVLSGLGGKSLANRVGLDSFSIGASDGAVTAPQVLQISKAFGERLLLGHEYGLSTSENLFKAVWQFSKYWSVAAHIGNVHIGKLKGCVLNFFRRFD